MNIDQEQLFEEIANRVKQDRDLSGLPKNPQTASTAKLLKAMHSAPRSAVPAPDFERVKGQILDRIAIPKEEPVEGTFGLILATVPRFLKIGGAIMGSFLILSSLAISVAVAALQSVPGQAIYPLKKVVEDVQLKLATDETHKTNLEIRFANNRLEELEILIQQSQQGKVSGAEVQKAVEQTVQDVTKTTSKVAQSANPDEPKPAILNKIVDLANKQTAILEAATINTEGEVKLELEKALEASKESKELAIENIERAGLKVEDDPLKLEDEPEPNEVLATGKITAVAKDSISIGTARFLLTKDTKFANIKQDELKVDQIIDIKAQIIQDKTYALEIAVKPEPTAPPPPPPAAPEDEDSSGQ